VKSLDIHSNSQRNIIFTNCTQQSTEVNQPINSMRYDNFLQIFEIQNIGKYEWAVSQNFFAWFDDIG